MQHEPAVEIHQNHQSGLCQLQLTPGRLLPFAGPSVHGLAIKRSATLAVFAGPAKTTACVTFVYEAACISCTDSSRVQSTDEAAVIQEKDCVLTRRASAHIKQDTAIRSAL